MIKELLAKLTKSNDPGQRRIWYPRRSAGIVIDHDNALTYSAIWRAVNLISQSIATLPWSVIEKSVDTSGNVTRKNLIDSSIAYILDVQSNDETDAQTWRETMIAHALTWGNGYSEIERNRAGQVVALWQIEPDRVSVERDEQGFLIYKVNNGTAPTTILNQSEMFHLKGLGFDGRVGYSVISYAARSIGLGIAAETYGGSFFENGANPGGVLKHPGQLSDKALGHLQDSLKDKHSGPASAMKPMILEEGMDFAPTTIPQRDAQFIESRQFNITDIARWYGVPPHKLMDMSRSTFNNIEHQSIEFVVDALIPWISRLEIESRIKLISTRNRRRTETKINVNGLLRGDSESRSNYYQKMMNLGVYSINEVRALEDENPIGADGDKRLVQLNQTTLEKIGEDIEPATNPVAPVEDDPEQVSEDDIEQVANKIFNRENLRLSEALTNYKDKPEKFNNWLYKFIYQHETYISDHVGHIIKSPDYINAHIERMRKEFFNVYTGLDSTYGPNDYVREIKKAMQ